jgi:hypothetical protein
MWNAWCVASWNVAHWSVCNLLERTPLMNGWRMGDGLS